VNLLGRLRHGLRRIVRRVAQRALDRTYDGSGPPPRLVDEVRAFRVLHPDAGLDEWEGFAGALAAGAWRDGWTAGAEWRDRWAEPTPFDERLLTEQERRATGWTQPVEDPGDPLWGVPLERRREVLAELEFAMGYGGAHVRFVDEGGRRIFPPALVASEEAVEDDDGGQGEDADGDGAEEDGGAGDEGE
jgi:hypothetical protein